MKKNYTNAALISFIKKSKLDIHIKNKNCLLIESLRKQELINLEKDLFYVCVQIKRDEDIRLYDNA